MSRLCLKHAFSKRTMATFSSTNVTQPFAIFDRNVKRMQRDRAAAANNGDTSRTVDYLRNEVSNILIERLLVRL